MINKDGGLDPRDMRGIPPNWGFGYTDDDTYDAVNTVLREQEGE